MTSNEKTLYEVFCYYCNTDHKYKFANVGPGEVIQKLAYTAHILKNKKTSLLVDQQYANS